MATTSISLIPLNGNAAVLGINCGSSVPKLGGMITLSAFPNLTNFSCINQDIVEITGYNNNSNITNINFGNNKISTNLPALSANTQLITFRCDNNLLSGFIPSLSDNTQLIDFRCDTNRFTGNIPLLNANTQLAIFSCHNNELTGFIPNLDSNTQLSIFWCHDQLGATKLTGSIPSLNNNTQLSIFWCHNNQLEGSIPSLSNNSSLLFFGCYGNQLTDFSGGSVSPSLGDFQAQDNQLNSAAVNAILAAFVAANKTTGVRVLLLGGSGNEPPTGQGITDKATLASRGWVINTN